MKSNRPEFSKEILRLVDVDEVVDQLCVKLRDDVFKRFRRMGESLVLVVESTLLLL